MFYFHHDLGKISHLTNFFQMGWNHQPSMFVTRDRIRTLIYHEVQFRSGRAWWIGWYCRHVEVGASPFKKIPRRWKADGSVTWKNWKGKMYVEKHWDLLLASGGFKYFYVHPEILRNDPIWLAHIFQTGWFHQLDYCLCIFGGWMLFFSEVCVETLPAVSPG